MSFDHDSVPVFLHLDSNLSYFKLLLDMKTTNYACWFNTDLSIAHTYINKLKIYETKLTTRCGAVGKLSSSTGELLGALMVGVRNALCGQGQVELRVEINLTLRMWEHLVIFT